MSAEAKPEIVTPGVVIYVWVPDERARQIAQYHEQMNAALA